MNQMIKRVFAGIVTFICLFPAADVFAQGRGYDYWHHPGMMGGYDGGWLGGILMFIFWIVVIVGIITLIWWLVHSASGGSHRSKTGDSAMEILKQRYAGGEISKKEFEAIKKDLS